MSIDQDLQDAVEQTRRDGHAIEESLKTQTRTVATSSQRLHKAVAKAAAYQDTELTQNQSLLAELDARHDYYESLRRDLDNVIAENQRQRDIVRAAIRAGLFARASLDADALK